MPRPLWAAELGKELLGTHVASKKYLEGHVGKFMETHGHKMMNFTVFIKKTLRR